MLGQALGHGAAGWPVFATRPDDPACPAIQDPDARCPCKAPLTEHGFKDATTDPAVIRSWWQRRPGANVAIATGEPGPDVLDVDVAPEGSGWAAFNRIKRAGLLTGARMLVRTPRGGLHVYFTGTSQGCGSLTAAGHFIDFKATGGYVVAPPSVVHGKPYEVLDRRDATGRLDWQAVRRLLDPPRLAQSRPYRAASDGDVTRLAEWVATRQAGDRNHPLYWAAKQAALKGALTADAIEQLVDAALRAGLRGGEAEARRTIASAARKAAAR